MKTRKASCSGSRKRKRRSNRY